MQSKAAIYDVRARRARRAASRNADHIQAGLAWIVEGEILPRLALSHREHKQASTTQFPTPGHVIAFARALVAGDPNGEWVRMLLEEGLHLDALWLNLFAPAARHLGRLWDEDEADLFDVTGALGRLQIIARALCTSFEGEDVCSNGRRILLMPCPGETHLFGLALVASYFRGAGWSVVVSTGEDDDPASLVRAEPFDLIGISLACDVLLPVMAGSVAKLRAASCNPDVRVMVGGPLFVRRPICAVVVGADSAAGDGHSAVRIAESLCVR